MASFITDAARWSGSDRNLKDLARECGGLIAPTYEEGDDCGRATEDLRTFVKAILEEGVRAGVCPENLMLEGIVAEVAVPWTT